ncbi:glycine betaine/proline transport system substrate-binding protein [Pseudomonas duriflava]|uniref:Glycine betaine/proline transport system substrate-binding protein n=1 Tax=Pseudomonas duriflava TaxID=459528 RepID=A0A562QFT4_9PSED|nr:ABC transporter substrate-binding protein [Pseudomonas duriflava]TWI55608.1 glycine betaine/proline transport system substrate-binding protein [Pseudomonas duriflava]
MRIPLPVLVVTLASTLGTVHSARAAEATCPYDKPVVFAGLNWESGMFTTELLRFLVEKGYGCKTDAIPGNTVMLENALAQNDIQVTGEQWAGRSPSWRAAEKAGKVFAVGETVKGATEGWWVPEYVVKGDPQNGVEAKAPGLKSVYDLPRYKALFKDPEVPGKGRFYNCPTGWTCEIVNTQKLKAYQLTDSYTNFRTGTGPALDTAISTAIRRQEPILFYYWSPTPLMGRFKLVQLEEPPFSEEAWETLSDPRNPAPKPSRSLPAKITIGVSRDFHDKAPALVQLFEKVQVPLPLFNQILGDMAGKHQDADKVSLAFLKQHRELWSAWMPEEAVARVDAALKDQ